MHLLLKIFRFILTLNQSAKQLIHFCLCFLSHPGSLSCSASLSEGGNVDANNTANCAWCKVHFTVDAEHFSTTYSTALLHEGRWIFLAGKINPCPFSAQFTGSFSHRSLQWTSTPITVSQFKELGRAGGILLLLDRQCRKAKLGTLVGLHATSF